MSTINLPTNYLNFETSLVTSISAGASSFTIKATTDDDSTALSGRYYLVIDEGNSSEEHFIVTLSGGTATVVTGGISRVDGFSNKTANEKAHDKGASVKITNSVLIHIVRLLAGTDTFNSVDWLGVNSISGLATPTSGETTKAADVAYVNAIAVAGASDAADNVKGILEIATQSELDAGTDTGSTSAKLSVLPSRIAQSIQNAVYTYKADAEASDSYAITLVPAITAYVEGQLFIFKANTANTGACTLNVNALGAKAIKKLHDQDLEDNDIEAGQIVLVIYDGTDFQMQTTLATQLTSAIASECTTFFSNTDMTGAEAETLTTGITTPIITLHAHKRASIVATRVANTGDGAVTYAHGLGVLPNWVEVSFSTVNAGSTLIGNGSGKYNRVNNTHKGAYTGPAVGGGGTSSTYEIVYNDGGLDQGAITVDATDITITWTKSGSPGAGNIYMVLTAGI